MHETGVLLIAGALVVIGGFNWVQSMGAAVADDEENDPIQLNWIRFYAAVGLVFFVLGVLAARYL